MVPVVDTSYNSQLTKFADMHPPMPKGNVARVMFVDFAESHLAGKTSGHPNELEIVVERVKHMCEAHPEARPFFANQKIGPADVSTIFLYIYIYIHILYI